MKSHGWLCVSVAVAAASAVGCAGAPAPGAAAPSAACVAPTDEALNKLSNEDLVRRMLLATNANTMGKQVMNGMLESLRKMPNLPDGFIDRFKQNVDPNKLTEMLVPIYLKHYDHQTLIAAVQFYESESGKAMVGQLPAVTAEGMEAGQAWGKSLAQKTLADMGLTPGQ